jgi:hypothetical protein
MLYYTGTGANACTRAVLYNGSPVTGGGFIAYGVPSANQVATDFHSIFISANDAGFTTSRSLQEDFHSLAARAASPFVLPSLIPTPSISTTTTPYLRLDMSVTMPSELNSGVTMFQNDQTAHGRTVTVSLSGPYIGGGAAALQVPDFSGLSGWSNAWAPAAGDVLGWILSGVGISTSPTCTEGHKFLGSSRSGQVN